MKHISLVIAAFAVFFLHSCNDRPAPRPVVVFGTDGFSAEVVKKNPGAFPNLEALMKEGSYSYEMRSILPSSSACNWKSIISGASPEIHGHTDWNSSAPEIEPRVKNDKERFPGIFQIIREQRPEAVTGYFYAWKPMGELGDKGMETKEVQGSDAKIAAASKSFISEANPDLTFIAFEQPDGAGHASGWESPEYVEACKVIDKYLGETIETIKASPRGAETIILFVADHGGINKKHGGKTLQELRPMFVMAGPGIKKEYNLQDSLMVYDIASTIAYFQQVTQPQAWIGRPITEAVEEK